MHCDTQEWAVAFLSPNKTYLLWVYYRGLCPLCLPKHTHKRTPTHTCSTSSRSPARFWLIAQMCVSWSWQLTECKVNWQSGCHGMRACAFLRPADQEASSKSFAHHSMHWWIFQCAAIGKERNPFFFFCWHSSASCLISCSVSDGPKVLQFCTSCGVGAIHNG